MDSMEKQKFLVQLRTKKIGLLLQDARLSARFEPTECSEALGIPVEQYLSYENGKTAPTLPEIEVLAYILNVPLEHFWGSQSVNTRKKDKQDFQRLLSLRNRVVQTRLRKTIQDNGITFGQLTEKTGFSKEDLEQILEGNAPVSMPELELFCTALNIRIDDFQDQKGAVGEWHRRQQSLEKFDKLTPGLQEFVSKPVNHPFIEVAQRLSNLSVDKLRNLAESLLEITY